MHALVHGPEETALLVIRRDLLGIEGVESDVSQFLGKQRKGAGEVVAGIDIPIELGHGIETFKSGVALVRRQTIDRRAHKSILRMIA